MEPLAKWCRADYIQKRVQKIVGNENKIILEDGSQVHYDVLALNVGSRTRGAREVKGVDEYSLTTRPINDLLDKITVKEQHLIKEGITPTIVVCGAGSAGTELSFGFKQRWSKLFGKDIKTTLVSQEDVILRAENPAVRKEVMRKLKEQNIDVLTGSKIKEIKEDRVILEDGKEIPCNVPIWATGAEP